MNKMMNAAYCSYEKAMDMTMAMGFMCCNHVYFLYSHPGK